MTYKTLDVQGEDPTYGKTKKLRGNIEMSSFQKLCSCTKNKRLAGFVIQTFDVKSRAKCMSLCLQHEDCTSVNVGRDSNEKFICELNKQPVKFHCSQLADSPNYNFYEQVGRLCYSSCKELKTADGTLPSRVYYIKPVENQAPFKVYCEMETAGGGWTLVYSYRFLDLGGSFTLGRLSVWPTWPTDGETPKSSVVPLSDLDEGAMEFSYWKEIGEEFLTTSTVTNWYACAPAATNGGSLTGWRTGNLDCSIANVQITGTGCDDVVPMRITFDHLGIDPALLSDKGGNYPLVVLYDGQRDRNYPVHDPCGKDDWGKEQQRNDDPRGTIYVR